MWISLLISSNGLVMSGYIYQATALKNALESKDTPANVYVGMRYWHPFTEEAISQVQRIKSPYPAKGTAISWEKAWR